MPNHQTEKAVVSTSSSVNDYLAVPKAKKQKKSKGE